MKKTAIVIGAGIGGLSTACRLANKGFEVTIFEASNNPGGKAAEMRMGEYRFDMGPSLFTMPELLDKLFKDCGKDPANYYSYDKLDVITRYHYPDGTVVNAYSEPEKLADEFEAVLGEDKKNVMSFLKKARQQYELTADMFLFGSMHKFSNYISPAAWKIFFQSYKLDFWRSMHSTNKSRFKDDRTVQLFDRYATYNGSDPYRAPGTLNLIAHLEHNIGAFFLKGGMHQISKSLEALAKDLGVKIEYGKKVDEILVRNKLARGIRIGEEEIDAGLVVSNMDIVPTYKNLLPHLKPRAGVIGQERSTSAMIFFWAMDKEVPDLELHNIFFAENYKKEFEAMKHGGLSDDLTVYLYISSLSNQKDAAKGGQNWFVMVNAPADFGQDWNALRKSARRAIIEKLEKQFGTDLEKHIVAEDFLDPTRIESRTSSFQGALYGASSNQMLSAFLRHPNFHPQIKNLFFCGGSVHPGGGIPLCLASAQIIDNLI